MKIMRMFGRYLFATVLIVLPFMGLKAQSGSLFGNNSSMGISSQPDFSLQLGTTIGTGLSGGMQSAQFLAPSLRWSPTPRLQIVAGGVFATGNLLGMGLHNSPSFGAEMSPLMSRPFSGTAYAAGAYQLNDRFTILGAGWIEHNNMAPMGLRMNPQAVNPMNRGMMVGFNYRITDNFYFGAQISTQSGFSPFQRMHQHGGFHPWGHQATPFGAPLGW